MILRQSSSKPRELFGNLRTGPNGSSKKGRSTKKRGCIKGPSFRNKFHAGERLEATVDTEPLPNTRN